MNLEKILTVRVLILVNITIIAATELTGTLFLETGLIHIIAFAFLLLGISRIFVHYKTFDQYLTPLVWGSIAALVLFSLSHLAEFTNFEGLSEPYSHELYVDVTNLYLCATLLIGLAAEWFLARRQHAWKLFSTLLVLSFGSIAFTVIGFLEIYNVSIEPDEPTIYVYSALVAFATLLTIVRLAKVGKAVSIVKKFVWYIIITLVLILASSLHYSFYEVLEHAGIPDYQIIYLSHFIFYAALSVMFLAFPKLLQRGGIYPTQ